jgi:hypothetical protein
MDREQKELEVLKEKFTYYRDLFRNFLFLLIALAGGTAGLLFKLENPIAVFLVFWGILLISGAIAVAFVVLDLMMKTIKELEEWKKR